MLAILSIKAVFVYASSAVAWILLKRYLFKSTLDDLPGPPSQSWLFGNVPQLFNPNGWDFHRGILERYGRALTIRGALGERILVTCDPKAMHHIVIKARTYKIMKNRLVEGSPSLRAVLFGEGLLSSIGEQHRKQRKMMNPVFSINHMREMIPLFYEVTGRLQKVLKSKVEEGPQQVDILHWMTRTALELIGQSGMGYSFDSLSSDDDFHPYNRSVKRLPSLLVGPVGFFSAQFLFPLATKFKFPRLQRFIIEHIPYKRAQELKEVVDLMHQTSVEIIEPKKKALASLDPEVVAEMTNKKGIISILMRANTKASEEDRLSDAEVIGQVSTFVFAAMDTTSSALSRIFWLLSRHQDVQQKLREEIQQAQQGGQLSYDQLVSLPYLDAVCRETLRVYTPLNLIAARTAQRDAILPFSKPVIGRNGTEISEIPIKKGTQVVIPAFGANCNPDLWGPDSYEWKPERWLSPLPKAVEEAHMPGVYSHVMTFLGGSHACIGFKFSQLEMKVVLSVLLGSFQFSPSQKDITWKMTGIAGPYVEGENEGRPQLPLMMRLVD